MFILSFELQVMYIVTVLRICLQRLRDGLSPVAVLLVEVDAEDAVNPRYGSMMPNFRHPCERPKTLNEGYIIELTKVLAVDLRKPMNSISLLHP